MRRDAACSGRRGARRREPVLRLFRFAPPGITLGHAQDPSASSISRAAAADGVPWAVRPDRRTRDLPRRGVDVLARRAASTTREWGGSWPRRYERASRLIAASLAAPRRAGASWRGARSRRAGERVAGASAGPAGDRVVAGLFRLDRAPRDRARGPQAGGERPAPARPAALLQQGSVLLGTGHLRLVDYVAVDPTGAARARCDATLGAAIDATRRGTWVPTPRSSAGPRRSWPSFHGRAPLDSRECGRPLC